MRLKTNSLLSKDPSKPPKLCESFGTPIGPAQGSPTTRLIREFEDVDDSKFKLDEPEDSSSGDSLPPISHVSWKKLVFPTVCWCLVFICWFFLSCPWKSKILQPLRPKSASRVGDRLSKGGYTESSIVAVTNYKKLQEKYHHLSQERDSLKVNLSRAEEEKKRVIHEGDEDVQKLQSQKESEVR